MNNTGPRGGCTMHFVGLISLCLLAIFLVSCGERASTYDPVQGRFRDTQEYRRDEIQRGIDRDREQRRQEEKL